MKNTITIGCDPEVFVADSTGQFISAHGLLPGNKKTPFPVKKGAVQIDGMACEFNTDPTASREDFLEAVQTVYQEMSRLLPVGVSPVLGAPVAHFSPEIYEAQPFEALELGCEADYSAYTLRANPTPNVESGTMRTAAGHIHIGFLEEGSFCDNPFEEAHFDACSSLVRHLDALVGVYSLTYDKDEERRAMYGAAGAFRPKPYGVEYRVLSNAWLCTPELIGSIFDKTVEATQRWKDGEILPSFMYEAAQNIINTSNFKEAEAFLKEVA